MDYVYNIDGLIIICGRERCFDIVDQSAFNSVAQRTQFKSHHIPQAVRYFPLSLLSVSLSLPSE